MARQAAGSDASITADFAGGTYAQEHVAREQGWKKASMTERVHDFRSYLPRYFPLPHPSWRTGVWERRNPWFVTDVLPALRQAVDGAFAR
jgi:uracil-DNA glycosylase